MMDPKHIEAVARAICRGLKLKTTIGPEERRLARAAIEAYESAKAAQQGEMLTIPEIETKGRRELS